MKGRDDAESSASANGEVESLPATAADGVILGCTELPLLLGALAQASELIDPGQLLAEAAVKAAVGQTAAGLGGSATERNLHHSPLRGFSDRLE